MTLVKLAINVGCGPRPSRSTDEVRWHNLDLRPLAGVDIVRDLRRGIPFGDDTFDMLLADNVLEHFASDDAIFLINEFHRVLKPLGVATVIVPHFLSPGSVQDPTHKSFYAVESALYWSEDGRKRLAVDVGITADFEPEIETMRGLVKFRLTKRAVDGGGEPGHDRP